MVNPVNKEEERQKFLFDELYNPQFEYNEPVPADMYEPYTTPSDAYLDIAIKIMDKVLEQWGSESAYITATQGQKISKEQVDRGIKEYVTPYTFRKDVVVRFSPYFLARTSMTGYTINVREPVEYKEQSFTGMLHHEIGTHLLRRMNEERQPWRQDKRTYGLHDYAETEEGLATIHAHMFQEFKYLWIQAVYYAAAYWALSLSFSELNEKLKKYIDDPARRWQVCLRVKRGIQDTSLPGSFAKDQAYFSGAISVLRWLSKNGYNPTQLYYGKISLEDVPAVLELSGTFEPVLPVFYTESPKMYAERLKRMTKQNMLSEMM